MCVRVVLCCGCTATYDLQADFDNETVDHGPNMKLSKATLSWFGVSWFPKKSVSFVHVQVYSLYNVIQGTRIIYVISRVMLYRK